VILYLDTSALVKRYFEEPGSRRLLSKWKEASEIVTSSVAYAEALAAFHRKRRESGLEDELFGKVLEAFRLDWKSFVRVEVTDELNEAIDQALEKHPLRGFDAIHLASAVVVGQTLAEPIVFACFDERLAQAAVDAGMETFPR